MAMRLSGLMSGMDTESIIQQLVEAKSTKLNTTKKAQIKANWKQDAWKELNTKLKNLQSKYISNMRFSNAYSKKVTKVSNDSAVSVITGENAVNGVQSLKINQLAKTGYLTGAELKSADGNTKGDYTALTKLSELGISGGSFSVKSSTGSVEVSVDGDTTISDVIDKLKSAGLNASFDTKTQRFYVSAKDSGVANDFSITASNEGGADALAALGLKTNLAGDAASVAEYEKYSKYYSDDRNTALNNMASLISADKDSRVNAYLSQYKSAMAQKSAAESKLAELQKQYADPELGENASYEDLVNKKQKKIQELKDYLTKEDSPVLGEEKDAVNKQIADLEKEVSEMEAQKAIIDKADAQIKDLDKYIEVESTDGEDGEKIYTAKATDAFAKEIDDSYYEKAKYAVTAMAEYNSQKANLNADGSLPKDSTLATKISGQDAIIELNGAEFTNNTNVFEINGLTFTALSETKEGETITVTTQNDTDGIYDMVKSFLKEYNSIINEMDKLYNADSAKGYEPLLTDEKEALSETEVKEYEDKIKASLLRGDSNLQSISSALKEIMSSGFEVNGKKMYLSNFGISTLGYFSAADNEKNAYHIDGDPDDDSTSGNADKLKTMISNDPDAVISFFTQLSQSLYSKMSDMSKSVKDYRSFGSFYDDKKMKSDYDDYTSKIATLEQKLNDYEDKWYSKFSKMETAMAKMQQNASAITSLLGG
ncbi:MAG: flagellar filament capping protein FliD [Clostridium sp.]|nr:flagellar filament capping protein FliD [Acetatifactor muris]MCM1526397.1 flagellar filament capping protein FliD [Bacteroides sp.]MCM1563240.1 flagellar filament capping protein FliD [Clostridium sp.]